MTGRQDVLTGSCWWKHDSSCCCRCSDSSEQQDLLQISQARQGASETPLSKASPEGFFSGREVPCFSRPEITTPSSQTSFYHLTSLQALCKGGQGCYLASRAGSLRDSAGLQLTAQQVQDTVQVCKTRLHAGPCFPASPPLYVGLGAGWFDALLGLEAGRAKAPKTLIPTPSASGISQGATPSTASQTSLGI